MNTKGNKHWLQTDKAIVEAVVCMADELGLSGVSVTAVCNSLGINRSTFYAHYNDVADVLTSTEKKLGNGLASAMVAGLEQSRRAAFEALFAYVSGNAWFYEPHLRHGGSISVIEHFGESPTLAELAPGRGDEQIDYRLAFFRGGVTALLSRWLEHGCTESPAQMCDILASEYRAWNQVVEHSGVPEAMRPSKGM